MSLYLIALGGRLYKTDHATKDAWEHDLAVFGNAVLRYNEDGTVEHIPLKDLSPDFRKTMAAPR